MAVLPSISVTFSNGTLSPAAQSPSIPLVVGPTSAPGAAGTVYSFSQPLAIASTIGDGPAQFAAARLLADNGGTIQVVPCAASIPGTLSTLTSGSTIPALAWSGAPYNSYVFSAQIVAAGGLGPETMHLVDPIVKEFPDVSIDAQGRLRPSESALDPVDWNTAGAYIIKALELLK